MEEHPGLRTVTGPPLWKFPLGGFGIQPAPACPCLPVHLLTPQREPLHPHQSFSCDQGKYYLTLLMFNAPTSSLAPHSQALSLKQRQQEKGSGDEPSLLGQWQGGRRMMVSVCERACHRVASARTTLEG